MTKQIICNNTAPFGSIMIIIITLEIVGQKLETETNLEIFTISGYFCHVRKTISCF